MIQQDSISLYDQFAGLAMQALLSASTTSAASIDRLASIARCKGVTTQAIVAEDAYSTAEAMLEERERRFSVRHTLQLDVDALRNELEKAKALTRKQGRELGEKDFEIERLLGEINRRDAGPLDPREMLVPVPHNPDGLTPDQVGTSEGYRLLCEDEICNRDPLEAIECYMPHHGKWNKSMWHGNVQNSTYRTKLSREGLRQARGKE